MDLFFSVLSLAVLVGVLLFIHVKEHGWGVGVLLTLLYIGLGLLAGLVNAVWGAAGMFVFILVFLLVAYITYEKIG